MLNSLDNSENAVWTRPATSGTSQHGFVGRCLGCGGGEHKRLKALDLPGITERGLHSDGDGFYLQVSKWGTKSWVLRYMLKGRARTMGLGSCREISLKQARERASRARELLSDPIRRVDPIEARKAKELADAAQAAATVTFREVAA